MGVRTTSRKGKAAKSAAKGWNLLSASDATPRKLEEPNTTVVLSQDEAAWFRKVHVETAKRSAASRASVAPRAATTSKRPRS